MGALERLFAALPATQHDPLRVALRDAAGTALDGTADALAGAGPAKLAPLKAFGETLRQRLGHAGREDEAALLLAGPVRLLTDDLSLLQRLQPERAVTPAFTT